MYYVKNDFIHLASQFRDSDDFNMLYKQKGVYPYDYMNDWNKYNECQLPPKENFYNSLKMSDITYIDYEYAQRVWNHFKVQTLGEYTDLYLKCDVLLLCDVFEHFRNISLKYYKLDPAHYVTSPGLSWDAMLFYTGVKIELIHDLEMYEMIERGIRGGLAQCSLRHAEANNPYLPHFDDKKQTSYLVYLDCNNLYGYAMTQKLPLSEFRFMTQSEIETFNIMDVSLDSEYGYILDIDLAYPRELHNLHKDLPFAPEKIISPLGKTPKLIANVYNKINYVIHYVHLQEL